MKPIVKIKRVYDDPSEDDGCRILVDRLWPRGLTKEAAALDEWIKELAPAPALRKWYGHAPERWKEFQKNYKEELKKNKAADDFIKSHERYKLITLLYGSKEEKYTHALVLQKFLERRFEVSHNKNKVSAVLFRKNVLEHKDSKAQRHQVGFICQA